MKRLLNKYKITNEAKQVGDIYHICTLKAYLKYILPNDTLQASGKYKNYLYGGTDYVSFTRDKYFVVGTDVVEMSSVLIQLVIDGNKLSERYKVGPYNDFTYDIETGEFDPSEDNFKHREKEEVVKGPIKNLSDYIKEIRIDSRRSVGGTDLVLLEKNKDKLKNCVYYNFIKDSTHLKALDVLKNGASFNEFLNILKMCVNPKSFAYKVKSGDINDIIDAIDAGYDINAPAINGDTLLSYYSGLTGLNKKDTVNIIKWLFKLGADPNAENMDGSTALDNAVLYNNYDIAKILLDNGIEVSDRTIDLVSDYTMKELLAKYDSSIELNEKYSRLENRLEFLEGKADQEILNNFLGDDYYNKYQLIKNKIKDPEYKDVYKLIKKNPDEVKDYIDNFQSKNDVRHSDKQAGANKIYEDDNWVVYKITSYPAAQLYGKNTRWCITGRYEGHEERGEEYFNDYINDYDLDGGYYFYINKHDPTDKYCLLRTKTGKIHSIWDAPDTNRGSTKMAVGFLPNVPGINLNNRNAVKDLYTAVNDNNYDNVERLLNAGINPNRITGIPEPVLFVAARSENKNSNKILELLLEKGADPNIKSKYGSTVLMQCEDANKVNTLLKYGADPNAKDARYVIPPLAFFSNNFAAAKVLIDNGADINAIISYGDDEDDTTVLEYIKRRARYDADAKMTLGYIVKNTK